MTSRVSFVWNASVINHNDLRCIEMSNRRDEYTNYFQQHSVVWSNLFHNTATVGDEIGTHFIIACYVLVTWWSVTEDIRFFFSITDFVNAISGGTLSLYLLEIHNNRTRIYPTSENDKSTGLHVFITTDKTSTKQYAVSLTH